MSLVPVMPCTDAGVPRRTHVLICVGNSGVRELIRILLEDAGCAATGMDVGTWLAEGALPGWLADVLILDAWPLRHAGAAIQARARLAAQSAAVVLLVDSPSPAHLADQLGAVATLPLLFTQQELVTAVQHGRLALTDGSARQQ